MTKDRLSALKAAQSEDEQDEDMHVETGNAQYMEEFFEQVCLFPIQLLFSPPGSFRFRSFSCFFPCFSHSSLCYRGFRVRHGAAGA